MTHLSLTPDSKPSTDHSNNCPEVQLGEPRILSKGYWQEYGWGVPDRRRDDSKAAPLCKTPKGEMTHKSCSPELYSQLACSTGLRNSSRKPWSESTPPQIWGEAFKNLANFHFPRHVTFCLSLGAQESVTPSWREGFSSEETDRQPSDALGFISLHSCLT